MAKKDTVLSLLKDIKELLIEQSVVTIIPPSSPIKVKPAPRVINSRFTDNGDGTITDNEQKVVWVKDPQALGGVFSKTMMYAEAEKACKELSLAGKTDWRVPTVQELRSIVDYNRYDPAWDINVFAGKHDNWYWTSTPCAWDKDAAWCVTSRYGGVGDGIKNSRTYVRPVRSIKEER